MQKSVSRVVPNVYITVSFSDEHLHNLKVTFAVGIGERDMEQLIISRQYVVGDCFYNARQEPIKLHPAPSLVYIFNN